jgi:hypothetical protein
MQRELLSGRKEILMRAIIALLLVGTLAACGNNYHPEYHPQTAVTYTQTVGTQSAYPQPQSVNASANAGQTVYVAPAGGPTAVFPPPPQPPQPPPDFPW